MRGLSSAFGQSQLNHHRAETQAALPDGQSAHACCWPSSTSRALHIHSMPCLSPRHVVCLGTDLFALTHRFVTFSVSLPATSVTPRCIWHCLTAASGSVQLRVCAAPCLQGSCLAWDPHPCCHRLSCGVWPWPQPDARRSRVPQAALSPRKGGMVAWYPVLLLHWLPFLFGSQLGIALDGFVLGYLMDRVSLYYRCYFVCLSNTCLLSVKSLFFCSFLPSGIATWSTVVSFFLHIWNTFFFSFFACISTCCLIEWAKHSHLFKPVSFIFDPTCISLLHYRMIKHSEVRLKWQMMGKPVK